VSFEFGVFGGDQRAEHAKRTEYVLKKISLFMMQTSFKSSSTDFIGLSFFC
jgi:hypothetical protein